VWLNLLIIREVATMIHLLLAVLAFAKPLLALPTISAKGSKFFTSDGSQFYIKGDKIYLSG
jgi:hypothetical protein